jgi:site-specific recombinase XerD
MRADAVVAEITPKNLSAYRNQRKVSANTQVKELECLKSCFWFCVNHGWLPSNPAKHLKPPVPDAPPTLPYERDEIAALLDACGRIENWYTETLGRARLRAKALVLLLLYSGFRISDAVQLERSRVEAGGKLLVRMMKTGNPLYVRIPQACVDALDSIPIESKYFFWSGTAKLSTAVGSARRTIDCLGRMTGINAHPHRFRDTFAVNLLLNGVDIRTVSLLLGHKSIRTTEKHYSPFVIGFQRMLDDAVGTLNFEG